MSKRGGQGSSPTEGGPFELFPNKHPCYQWQSSMRCFLLHHPEIQSYPYTYGAKSVYDLLLFNVFNMLFHSPWFAYPPSLHIAFLGYILPIVFIFGLFRLGIMYLHNCIFLYGQDSGVRLPNPSHSVPPNLFHPVLLSQFICHFCISVFLISVFDWIWLFLVVYDCIWL